MAKGSLKELFAMVRFVLFCFRDCNLFTFLWESFKSISLFSSLKRLFTHFSGNTNTFFLSSPIEKVKRRESFENRWQKLQATKPQSSEREEINKRTLRKRRKEALKSLGRKEEVVNFSDWDLLPVKAESDENEMSAGCFKLDQRLTGWCCNFLIKESKIDKDISPIDKVALIILYHY